MEYPHGVRFDWDPEKARSNLVKHGLSFDEATGVFAIGVERLERMDLRHCDDEIRFHAIGPIERGIVCVVVAERDESDVLRIVSARFATRAEIRDYRNCLRGRTP